MARTNKSTAKTSPALGHPEEVPVGRLELDPENPRLAEYNATGRRQDDLVVALWQRSDAKEIAMSVAHGGFARHEPLLVEKKPRGDQLTVIEGNRRLTAVRVLLDPRLRKLVGATDLPAISAELRASLSTLPCAVTTKRDSWRYLGFKHVNGPATWGSYAKAKYIADIHENYGVSLQDIALQIGDQNATVERLYHGLAVVKQAEEWGVFRRENTAKNSFHFSHIYTGLGYDNIRTFLDIKVSDRSKARPVKKSKKKALGDLLLWIYGNREQTTEPKVKSQNPDLRTLDRVLGTPKGIAALRADLPLANARDAADGDTELLRKALEQSKHYLQKASYHSTLGASDASPEALSELVDTARATEILARKLYKDLLSAADGD